MPRPAPSHQYTLESNDELLPGIFGRVTPDLLTSRGKDTGKCLKRLSKSADVTSGARDLAALLLRSWRGVVSGLKNDETPRSISSVEGKKEMSGKGKTRSGKVPEVEKMGGVGKRVLAGSTVSSSLAVSEESSSSATLSNPPKRPSLVPVELWDRLSIEFNHSQVRAVWAATATAREQHEESLREREQALKATTSSSSGRERAEGGVVLLQGPPGTGKTRTVLGLVSAILARRKEKVGVVNDVGGRGSGTTLAVGSGQKRPTVAERWAAVKAHQRVSFMVLYFAVTNFLSSYHILSDSQRFVLWYSNYYCYVYYIWRRDLHILSVRGSRLNVALWCIFPVAI